MSTYRLVVILTGLVVILAGFCYGQTPTSAPATAPAAKPGGAVFSATLTKLDNSKLNLPQDLQGKVVVVDFWATWCPPCLASIPDMKKTYADYKGKGVEFVGISLDKEGQLAMLQAFVKENGMVWLQTYSGRFWDDPNVGKYKVDGIPTTFVVGKDGGITAKIVGGGQDDALRAALDKALKAGAPVPATKPSAATKPSVATKPA